MRKWSWKWRWFIMNTSHQNLRRSGRISEEGQASYIIKKCSNCYPDSNSLTWGCWYSTESDFAVSNNWLSWKWLFIIYLACGLHSHRSGNMVSRKEPLLHLSRAFSSWNPHWNTTSEGLLPSFALAMVLIHLAQHKQFPMAVHWAQIKEGCRS